MIHSKKYRLPFLPAIGTELRLSFANRPPTAAYSTVTTKVENVMWEDCEPKIVRVMCTKVLKYDNEWEAFTTAPDWPQGLDG